MKTLNFAPRFVAMGLFTAFLVGCSAPTPTPIPPPPPLQPNTPLPPPMQPNTPLPPPNPAGTPVVSPTVEATKETTQADLFKPLQTIHITPDSNYLGGGFVRINYVPATDRFVVTFGASLVHPPSDRCLGGGYVYIEYSLDLKETGQTGVFSCENGDSGSLMVDNTFYFVSPTLKPAGWHLTKFSAANWTKLADTYYVFSPQLGDQKQPNNDPMVAFVNGQLDISSQYNPEGHPPNGIAGAATYHDFFSTDLKFLGQKILTDPPQLCGTSMIYRNGLYYFLTSNSFLDGDLTVVTYDQNWKLVSVKKLLHYGQFSTGLAFDGQRFYVAYLNNSLTLAPDTLPVYLNVHLAAFDLNWNFWTTSP